MPTIRVPAGPALPQHVLDWIVGLTDEWPFATPPSPSVLAATGATSFSWTEAAPASAPYHLVAPGRYPAFEGTLYRGAVHVEAWVGSFPTTVDGVSVNAAQYRCRWAGATATWVASAVELGKMGVPVTVAS